MAAEPPGLRDYQISVCGRTWAAIDAAVRGILIVAPTGSGKTVIAGAVVRAAVDRGRRVMFVAHRRELIRQAHAKLLAVGIDAGTIQAGFTPRPAEPVQVASVQTLYARTIRSNAMEMPPAEIVIVDEAHHVRARSYRQILARCSGAIVIGLTATPCRGDGRGLGDTFGLLIQCPSVAALTAAGWLVPARLYAPTLPDLTGVRVARGDYVEHQLAERMDRPQLVGDVVENWLRLAEGRPTIVFATSVAHSVHLRNAYRAGVLAEHIDGTTPVEERDAILAQLAAGSIEVICNCMVLTEGFDAPDISCLVLARPTKSLGLYLQMIGRGLRPAPGKRDCIVLDHAGAVFEHGLPDDPIEWALEPDHRAENKAHAARGTHSGAPRLVDCPECHAVKFEGRPCPVCGWRPRPMPRPVEVIEGDLAPVDRRRRAVGNTYTSEQQHQFYLQLLWIARELNYKPGWAWFKFKEKFGFDPLWRNAEPTEPDPAVRSWVRSRAIAYAKAMQKAGGRS